MRIANIYPVANQELYENEQIVMILAHLVKKGLYNPAHFNNKQYIIMDNGLFEGQQVSTSLTHCVELAKSSKIPVNEIIVPDAINDCKETQRLFKSNLRTMKKYAHEFAFMGVAQATTYEELDEMIEFYNGYADKLALTVGISKLTPLDRGSFEAVKIYRKSKCPIHFLGIKKSFDELDGVRDVIRSCDTSQIAYLEKNVKCYPTSVRYYERDKLGGIDIDLENDKLSTSNLKLLRNRLEFYYGIL